MHSRNSNSRASRITRLDRLKSRLQTLTQDYAPFFAGFSPDNKKAAMRGKADSLAVLTDLQQLRRAQLAFMLNHASSNEDDAPSAWH
ncbi:MAG: hypothetical protein ACLP7P_01000 [Rhodomicrobium sp.]